MLNKDKPITYDLNIGQVRVVQHPAVLTCFGLGSCLGVFLFDHFGNVGGGAHIQLPGIESEEDGNHAYANIALNHVVSSMRKAAAPLILKAKIAGGANVINSNSYQIGKRNIEAVRNILKSLQIKIVGEDVGGVISRTARLSFPENTVEIKTSEGKKYII